MSQDEKDPEDHPHRVAAALEILEQLAEGCKNLAETLALDELEGETLNEITERILALYDQFMDRELVAAYEANGLHDDPDVLAAQERIRARIMQNFLQSGKTHLQQIALKALPTDGKPH